MHTLRPYQAEIANQAIEILNKLKIVYLCLAVRTGKTAISLETAKLYNAKNVLFLTKKKAITSILSDYNSFGYTFNLTVINNESLHLTEGNFDLIINDEAHRLGTFAKPNKITKLIKSRYSNVPMIFLSGTPHPESFSQIFHQFWVSDYSPFKEYTNFYKWATKFVTITQKNFGFGKVNDYSNCNYDLVQPIITPYFITYTQQQAGFSSSINETILNVKLKDSTYSLINKLKKDLVIQGKEEVILGETAVKLMSKLHQLYSGTIKFESGNTMTLDNTKAVFIKNHFKGKKIAIFYKFKEELTMIEQVFGDEVCVTLDEFNATSKNIACQLVSFREGISLKLADYIVYLNIDFSALTYTQSRDRMTTIDRPSNDIFWIFSEKGIEQKIYKAVMNKKNYTQKVFQNDGATIPD